MHSACLGPQFWSGRRQPRTPRRPDPRVGYSEALARVRARRADERDRAADERDRTADERDQIADQREALADQRERAADQREEQFGARAGKPGRGQAELSNEGREGLARAAARTARNLARISREKSAGRRAEAARRRVATAAPYWPGEMDGETARVEFLALRRRQRETIAQARAAAEMARALCESARETVAQVVAARAKRTRS